MGVGICTCLRACNDTDGECGVDEDNEMTTNGECGVDEDNEMTMKSHKTMNQPVATHGHVS
jgi:hypothetical protein